MDNIEWRNNNWEKSGEGSFSFVCKTKPALSTEHCVGEFKAALGLSRKGHTEVCLKLQEGCKYICYRFAFSGAEHPSQMCNQTSESTGCLIGKQEASPFPPTELRRCGERVPVFFKARFQQFELELRACILNTVTSRSQNLYVYHEYGISADISYFLSQKETGFGLEKILNNQSRLPSSDPSR